MIYIHVINRNLMIEKIDRVSGRVFANDYAFFIVVSLVFGGVCYLISYSLYRLGIFFAVRCK